MATLESKLLQKIEVMQNSVLYEIFADIHKAYGTLDQGRALNPPGLSNPDPILG